MTRKVVDASVVAAILFEEPEAEQALALLKGFDLIAPHILAFEVANVAVTKSRRRPEEKAQIAAALSAFEDFGVELLDVSPQSVLAEALAVGLSGYDASYLCLCKQERAQLATFDRRLGSAAQLLNP